MTELEIIIEMQKTALNCGGCAVGLDYTQYMTNLIWGKII